MKYKNLGDEKAELNCRRNGFMNFFLVELFIQVQKQEKKKKFMKDKIPRNI
ncbi:hypothetical protein G210_0447 [Candida maltosa Xu316]|uniref:Uncharacterized protein n=1 Tax=Candida maltosa (strain Xu316) TaxID=1245528 RepID=M3HN62_CANMX|nr:hypothetical protein G210_0447 [Candida maltosa Xu316]